uniref:Uncharacterized protein n=1 Tax=uncultured marine virus TaxID=186617 RepID=A0A0F7L153_9VIRU|nr:hypothetical protein [uncultured marine virus]
MGDVILQELYFILQAHIAEQEILTISVMYLTILVIYLVRFMVIILILVKSQFLKRLKIHDHHQQQRKPRGGNRPPQAIF